MTSCLMLSESYPHSLEHVWQALTNSEALAAWLMDNNFEPHVGHRFQFQDSSPGLKCVVDCEVIALDPPRRLVYTWQTFGMSAPSTVTWLLTPTEGGTRVQLHHSGLRESGLRESALKAAVISARAVSPIQQQPSSEQAYRFPGQQIPRAMLTLSDTYSQPEVSAAGHLDFLEITAEDIWRQRLQKALPTVLSQQAIA
ncbi:MAG: SRPBCC domain-containing protein [Phormidesmis sp.]